MAVPVLTPASVTSAIVLPVTGTYSNVNSTTNPLPFGIYTTAAFVSGAVDQVAYVYKKLGGDVLDLEITEYQIYAAYEESILEYSYIINSHQAKNVLSDLLGNSTASFDEDGQIIAGDALSGSHVELKFPRFTYSYSRRIADGISTEARIGGSENIYSASFNMTGGVQDYDLQTIISSSATDATMPFYNTVKNNKITVRKVYYRTPRSMWRFYGYYGGMNVVGNMSTYGQFADDSTFQIVPVWQNKAQAMAYEDAIYTRISHWSYEIKNNNLRLFPIPINNWAPEKFWIEFTVHTDAWIDEADSKTGADGINNMNTMPFENIPYININSVGKQWIRRFALALSKEMLGQVRSKFASIPIPNEAVTLNGEALITQGKEEQEKLREELKTLLDEITYTKLAESDAALVDSSNKVLQQIPFGVFVG
jgi:hypothetical protein